MSPRRNRSPKRGGQPTSATGGGTGDRYGGFQQTETWQGEEWSVRHVAGAATAGKRYRCPGCDQEIPPSVAHVVAWPDYGGVDDRRHWHKACWNAKDRRTAKVQRSRNAPRH
ncbi:ATP/GTP-binding protein [Streptomyces sp. CC53]|uniref:ATP/GTP-binding protein n=1 Tax=unclassified Streptomyces TaxID=2593676 RepID=UPI0008DD8C01|nr:MULTISPECIES: ATP/GTP-binding protein [unclassified Streptomyces]OII65389.1 ATP/GTP-binding protein [Streptomyces sp. CC53]OII67346.1 ATP/GTP-binding protein [Streptomyces sp. CC77]